MRAHFLLADCSRHADGAPLYLALCPTAPPSMQREAWCIADYTVMEKLYQGYASKGARAAHKRSYINVDL